MALNGLDLFWSMDSRIMFNLVAIDTSNDQETDYMVK
jgi:hypothetical protein